MGKLILQHLLLRYIKEDSKIHTEKKHKEKCELAIKSDKPINKSLRKQAEYCLIVLKFQYHEVINQSLQCKSSPKAIIMSPFWWIYWQSIRLLKL